MVSRVMRGVAFVLLLGSTAPLTIIQAQAARDMDEIRAPLS